MQRTGRGEGLINDFNVIPIRSEESVTKTLLLFNRYFTPLSMTVVLRHSHTTYLIPHKAKLKIEMQLMAYGQILLPQRAQRRHRGHGELKLKIKNEIL